MIVYFYLTSPKKKNMVLMIDNYDSFTYNVVQYLKELGENVYTVRNDEIDYSYIDDELKPRCIVISPGPKSPTEAGQCLEIIDRYKGVIPIFGVCLGHQCIGHAFGGEVIKASTLMHGKNSVIKSLNKGVFENFPQSEFSVTRYHSLVINPKCLPLCLEVTCISEDGEIMGVRHRDYLIEGVQFHPEAVQSQFGLEIFKRFLDKCPKQAETQVEDNTEFKSQTLTEDSIEKVIFHQEASVYNFEGDFYKIFQEIYQSGKYEDIAFFDSASGPRKDANISSIGIGKLFSLKIKEDKLLVEAENKGYKSFLNKILQKFLQKLSEDKYSMSGRRFSEVFEHLKNTISIERKHQEKIPLSFPLVGYFAYEYIHFLENIPKVNKDPLDLPDVELHFYSNLIIHDIAQKKIFSVHNFLKQEKMEITEPQILNFLKAGFGEQKRSQYKTTSTKDDKILPQGERTISKEDYLNIIARNKDYVINGDIFQVQISIREKLRSKAKAIDIYTELRNINPSPYMCFFKTHDFELVCNSPELQFSIKDNTAMIRPIAGTSPGKGTDEKSRREILEQFAHDAKENAEHLMLVDLARNDLGRMASTGTVRVNELMTIEEYANVFHLTSTVTGELQDGLNVFELFEATFPAGTLTGAPKIRAMEIIAEHEPETRGLYGGAIGIFDLDLGNIMSTIVIRSVLCKDDYLYLQSAAGTVADSVPEKEWSETNHKLSTLKQAIVNVSDKE